jgi:hypothetical protein
MLSGRLHGCITRKWTHFEEHILMLHTDPCYRSHDGKSVDIWMPAGCDLTVILMIIATVWQTTRHQGPEQGGAAMDGRMNRFLDGFQLVLTLFFGFQVLLKVLVCGWKAYWRRLTNRCALTAVLVLPRKAPPWGTTLKCILT